jgi:three-Cys-motif partner protein
MPVKRGVGSHPQSTPKKQGALDGFARHLLGATGAIAKKYGTHAVVLDMTCGPGLDDEGNQGSPLIFAKHIAGLQEKGYSLDFICVDRRPKHLRTLQTTMQQLHPDLSVHYETDQRVALASLPVKTVGLAYFDPTHYADLDADLLRDIGQRFYQLDILFTRQCQAYYRMRGAQHTASWVLSPQDYLDATGKQCRYVVEYATYNSWMFGFADNWTARPAGKMSWPNGQLLNIETPQGQLALKQLMNQPPDEEPPCEQMTLFG